MISHTQSLYSPAVARDTHIKWSKAETEISQQVLVYTSNTKFLVNLVSSFDHLALKWKVATPHYVLIHLY